MRRIQQCLEQINRVREAAQDMNSAYLLRARTHRMLLSIQRVVAAEYGSEVLRPTGLDSSKNSDPALKHAAELTNELLAISRHLSQRSAAFDRRWQQEWNDVESVLIRLEICLRGALPPRVR